MEYAEHSTYIITIKIGLSSSYRVVKKYKKRHKIFRATLAPVVGMYCVIQHWISGLACIHSHCKNVKPIWQQPESIQLF